MALERRTEGAIVLRSNRKRRGPVSPSLLGVAVASVLSAAACANGDEGDDGVVSPDENDDTAVEETEVEIVDPYEGHSSEIYEDTDHWICHPDLDDDVCADLTATVLAPDGSIEPADLAAAPDPNVDCFYVYPTVSAHPDTNSTLEPGNEEISTVRAQAAPFASTCRVFAPVYRQLTLSAIAEGGFANEEARELAYGDVVDAWRTYVSQHNDGRGVVLMGHSQGSGHLTRLIADEIETEPVLRERVVSAILLGTSLAVPDGEDVGGAFEDLPVCQEPTQVGCVIAFASYPRDAPPEEGARFGYVDDADMRAVCSDPVALSGADVATAILPMEGLLVGATGLVADLEVDDPNVNFLVLPDALEVGCEQSDDHDYLAASLLPGEERPIDGLVEEFDGFGIQWGLHLLDANLALGNLLDIVAEQSEAFAASG
jgi:pimeloyl-ACP methyl ester carboxylesterase